MSPIDYKRIKNIPLLADTQLDNLLTVFENRVISAWQYDTELNYKDDFNNFQTKRSITLHEAADEARNKFIDELQKVVEGLVK